MDTKSVLNLFNTMVNENIVYIFHGEFNFTMVDTLLADVKRELSNSEAGRKIQKKTYKILVECLENAYRHSVEHLPPKLGKQEGIFILSRKPEGYCVIVGNPVQKSDVEILTEKIEETNSFSREELKEKYKSIIKTTTISEKGGAGLGLMDIAIKSGNKLLYNFNSHKDNTEFFTLEINISE